MVNYFNCVNLAINFLFFKLHINCGFNAHFVCYILVYLCSIAGRRRQFIAVEC